MKKKKISVIPTFHHDIAYLKPEKDYYYKATEILNKACELMEKDENYTFTVEQSYFFERYWNENPEKHDILKKFFVNGQLNFAPGMWGKYLHAVNIRKESSRKNFRRYK